MIAGFKHVLLNDCFLQYSDNVGAKLKHSVLMASLGRNNLQNVPVFNDFPVCIKTENVYAGPILVRIGGPNLMTMKHHQVAFCHGSL